jgi:hypothetical protein
VDVIRDTIGRKIRCKRNPRAGFVPAREISFSD